MNVIIGKGQQKIQGNLLNNEICQRQNKKAKTAVPELNYASIGQRVWGKIGIDLIGPFLIERKKKIHCWS